MSSSSFIVNINIQAGNSTMKWSSGYYNLEDNGEIIVDKSPKQLAQCDTIDELINMIQKAVQVKFIGKRTAIRSNSTFLQDLRKLKSMNEIDTISISAEEQYRNHDRYDRSFTYDLNSSKYVSSYKGGLEESAGTGGELIINDYTSAVVGGESNIDCMIKIILMEKSGKAHVYETEELHLNKKRRIKINHSPKELGDSDTVSQLFEYIDHMLSVGGKYKNISGCLFNSKPIEHIECIDTITLIVSEGVIGEQCLDGQHITSFWGTTKYVYSVADRKETVSKEGARFDHEKGALVEMLFDKEERVFVRKEKPVNSTTIFENTEDVPNRYDKEDCFSWMKGKIFVHTGFDYDDEIEFKSFVTAQGGIIKSSTVSETSFLVYNAEYAHFTTKLSRGCELQQAGRPIQILSMEEWDELLNKCRAGEEIDNLFPAIVDKEEESIIFPEGITRIEWGIYQGNTKVKSVVIPEGVVEIGVSAFSGCASLEKVCLPKSLVRIEQGAFYRCTALKEIDIPDDVTYIGENAFAGCKLLSKVTLGKSILTIGSKAFMQCGKLTAFIMQNSVEEIGYKMLYQCSELEQVVFSNKLKYISQECCYGCKKLKTVSIPFSVQKIYQGAFDYCDDLVGISIPGRFHLFEEPGLGLYGSALSRGVSVLEEGTQSFHDEVRERYSRDAWYDSEMEKRIRARMEAEKQSVKTADYETAIDEYLLSEHTVSKGFFSIPECNLMLGDDDIANFVNTIEVGNEMTIVREDDTEQGKRNVCCVITLKRNEITNAINLIVSLKYITIRKKDNNLSVPEGTIVINKKEYAYRNDVISICLPDTVTEIGDEAFIKCEKLEEASLSRDLKQIGESAFFGCNSMKRVKLYDSVTEIGDNAFGKCVKLEEISMPADLRRIGDQAFYGCNVLKEVAFHDSLFEIGDEAFKACNAVQKISIPSSVNKVGKEAFALINNLKVVDLSHSSMRRLEDGLFNKCKGLIEVYLPESLKEIGENVFKDCPNLEIIHCPENLQLESISASALKGTKLLANQAATYIGGILCFSNEELLNIKAGTKNISEKAIGTKVKKIAIPKSIEKICVNQWKQTMPMMCNFEEIVLEEGITSIGDKAFYDCKCIKRVFIPESVTEISSTAFLQKKKIGKETIEILMTHILMIGKKGSYAERYASLNGFNFQYN